MAKLFQKKDPAELRSIRVPIRLTKKEDEKIRHSASVRNMAVSEFVRRAALSRKADVAHEMEIVSELSAFTKSIQALHANLVERGIAPTESELRPLISKVIATMQRIDK